MQTRRWLPSLNYARHTVALGLLLAGGPLTAPAAATLGAQGRRSVPKPETPPARVPNARPQQFLVLRGPDLALGEDGGEGPLLFAHVAGVVEFADGTLVVAEGSDFTLRVFDRDGRHLSTFGRRGRGPGEFSNPMTLLKLDERRLLVLQPFFGATLLHRDGGTLSLARAATREWDFASGCAGSSGAVVAAWDGTHALRRLGPALEPVRAFGAGWSTDSTPALIEMENRGGGILACSPDGRIAFTQASGPRVRLYEPDDRLRWETTLPSYRYSQYLMTGAPGGRRGAATIFYGDDFTSAAWFLDAQTLVVQVSRRDLASGGSRARNGAFYPDVVSVTTYFVHADDGRLLGRTTSLPSLSSGGGPSMFRTVDDPFPQVQRYRLTPVSDSN
jgi:hypothetical protein